MLNVKRFVRSVPLRFSSNSIFSRADAEEQLLDRIMTFVRKIYSPVFAIITDDTLKEYRILKKKAIFRIRGDRIIRGHLEAIEQYSRLILDGNPFPQAIGEARNNQLASADVLEQVLRVCDSCGLKAWLGYQSLLGAVCRGGFPQSEEKATVLMPRSDYERLESCVNSFPTFDGMEKIGAKLISCYGGVAMEVAVLGVESPNFKSGVIIIPCDYCPDDWKRERYFAYMRNAGNKARIKELTAANDTEGLYSFFATARKRLGIGMEKGESQSIFPGWDCPSLYKNNRVLGAQYYLPLAKLSFEGRNVSIPADSDMVLASMYGDYHFAQENS
jgi:hypothetical protein